LRRVFQQGGSFESQAGVLNTTTMRKKISGKTRPTLLRNTRKTECGTKQFLAGLVVRAAPFALLTVAVPIYQRSLWSRFRRGAGGATGFALEGRPHVEEPPFDVAGLVEAHQALRARFNLFS
jgi:hypothetical protein